MVLYCIKALTCLLIIYISLNNCDAKIQRNMSFYFKMGNNTQTVSWWQETLLALDKENLISRDTY